MEAGQALRANAISFWGSIVGGTWLPAACCDCAIANGLRAMWAASANKQIAVTATPLPWHINRFFIEFLLCFVVLLSRRPTSMVADIFLALTPGLEILGPLPRADRCRVPD